MAMGDLADVLVHYTTGGSIVCENRLGMQSINVFSDWRTRLAAEFRDTILPDWRTGLVTASNIIEIRVRDVVPGTGADVVLALGPVTGTLSGLVCPKNCAYCLSIRSDGIGRSTRGRIYLTGMRASEIFNGQQWDNGVQAWVEDLASVLLAQYGPTGFSDLARWQVISRVRDGAPLTTPQPFPVTHVVFDSRLATMRKRSLRDV